MTQSIAAANRLIVALDVLDADAEYLALRLIAETPVRFFKLNAAMLLQPEGWTLAERIGRLVDDTSLFLDLKIYDTADTVYNIARRAFDLGARFLTVHATQSMLEAAMRAKPPGDYAKVLAIGSLTDGGGSPITGWNFDGLVCSAAYAQAVRRYDHTDVKNKILVCPGIRPTGMLADNHAHPATPAEAIRAGADYIVVGRPIIQAQDPAAAARDIIAEMEEISR